jgi:hypothetical protein
VRDALPGVFAQAVPEFLPEIHVSMVISSADGTHGGHEVPKIVNSSACKADRLGMFPGGHDTAGV